MINYLVNLWEKPTHQGKGRKVGEMRCGSRAIILAKDGSDYKVQSPLDKSVGWINEVQLINEHTKSINWKTKEECDNAFIAHIIKPKETLLDIIVNYDVQIEDISYWNDFDEEWTPEEGEILLIPMFKYEDKSNQLSKKLHKASRKLKISHTTKAFSGLIKIFFYTLVLITLIILLVRKVSSRKNKYYEESFSDYEDHYEESDDYTGTDEDLLNDDEKYGKILGLDGAFNKAEIQKAYKQKMKEYHPDKISNMAEELQNLALKRTKEINEAYEFFRKKYNF